MRESLEQVSSGWYQPSGQPMRRAKDAAAFFRTLPLKTKDGRTAELLDIQPGEHNRSFFFQGRVRLDGVEVEAHFSANRAGEYMWWTVAI